MNILVIGSRINGLAKALDWLKNTTYIINKLVFVEEGRAKLDRVHSVLDKVPHEGCVYNLSCVPDGEEGTPQKNIIGRAMDVSDIIEAFFPCGSVDYLFFAVKNKKAKIILRNIDTERVAVHNHYLAIHEYEDLEDDE